MKRLGENVLVTLYFVPALICMTFIWTVFVLICIALALSDWIRP